MVSTGKGRAGALGKNLSRVRNVRSGGSSKVRNSAPAAGLAFRAYVVIRSPLTLLTLICLQEKSLGALGFLRNCLKPRMNADSKCRRLRPLSTSGRSHLGPAEDQGFRFKTFCLSAAVPMRYSSAPNGSNFEGHGPQRI